MLAFVTEQPWTETPMKAAAAVSAFTLDLVIYRVTLRFNQVNSQCVSSPLFRGAELIQPDVIPVRVVRRKNPAFRSNSDSCHSGNRSLKRPPGGGKHHAFWVADESEMNTFPAFSLPTLFPKVEREDDCETSVKNKWETVETKRSIYLCFHMCSTQSDTKSLSQEASNRWSVWAICFSRPYRSQAPRFFLLHIKIVFHINWLVFDVIDKLQSKGKKKRQNWERERETSVCEQTLFCCHTLSFFFFDTLVYKEGEVSRGNVVN